MSQLDIKSASAVLLTNLDSLFGDYRAEVRRSESPTCESLQDCRRDLDDVTKRSERISWAIATLLHSLDEIRQTRQQLMQTQTQLLDKANQLVAAKTTPDSVQLPYEILCHIAQYVFLDPISVQKAVDLRSSGCKWAGIVLKSSLIKLDRNSVDSIDLPYFLSTSSPAKLMIDLEKSIPKAAVQSLLPFSRRWHTLSVGPYGAGKPLTGALFSIPCPNCPPLPVEDDAREECKDHIVLSSLNTFATPHWAIRSFSGLLKHINHISLKVLDVGDAEATFDWADLAAEAPLLSELTIVWRTFTIVDPLLEVQNRTYFPNLRRIVFIQEICELDEPERLEWLQFIFSSLDCRGVEELCVYILHPIDPLNDKGPDNADEPGIMKFLGGVFTSLKSLTLRSEPTCNADDCRLGVLESQRRCLEFLVAEGDQEALFPHLTHLSIELDPRREGTELILQVLNERYEIQLPSLPKIQSLDLFQPEENWIPPRSGDMQDFLSRVQPYIRHLTLCTPVENDSDK